MNTELIRRLKDTEAEYGLPCYVGHGREVEQCKRPSTMRVYGLPFCPEHGKEAASGAVREMKRDAHTFVDGLLDNTAVAGYPNPLVRRVAGQWASLVPEFWENGEERDHEALKGAFPFDEEKMDRRDILADVADSIEGNDPPLERLLDARSDVHSVMRFAFESGAGWLVEDLEDARESAAQQAAFVVSLLEGEHPDLVAEAHRENVAEGLVD